MAPPFQPIRSALRFWMRRHARNDESASYTEQDWWPLRYSAKLGSRVPPSASRSSGQWSSALVTDEASSGAASSRRGSSSHGSLQQSNSVESNADSSIELTDRGSKESLVRGGIAWQGLENASQYMRAPAIACIVFVGAFATAMVVKSAFGIFSGEENAEFASDPPVHLQLPSNPLQPDDSGPGGSGALLPSVLYATPGRAFASSGDSFDDGGRGRRRTNSDSQRMREEIMALARSPSCWRPLMVFVFSLVIGATLALAAYGIRGARLRGGGGMHPRGNGTY
ncbi:hypothetical protein HPB52_020865 [Rhipicephalus sanguineus]|uniref:Uncharacterized protein n=1 Tax=Rhipicephalus sanguineus TaxID=34632 RepID=A0A9D4T1R2_RHISA|nr:hypothetical protein HPB52_020865 [Rhipicephalus sanguineus]